MHDDKIKDVFKQDENRRGAPDSNMSYDEQNDNPMEPGEKSPKETPDTIPNENNDQEGKYLLHDESKDEE
ncbi:hypothetical protein SIN07_02860 [Pediococcus inopinatus]|uniref:Uncharacterized protein n=1 Tax=Pediococcus inopinatus TaxID=114090 RepID=A0ABZ0Q2Q4_9LACO|nr:hypothetical protein [Pediococcus inopinatus]AVL00337.1 hypothetical protein PI20285_06665 [Pediococcus inopinatus]KRN63342.1 hypothetical protein IV83_GL001049 [Pediococcus inopinatus]WPC17997.1 hypothetical protein N6G94_03040 [Pediococcus inopinatus]WPC19547.1 hypothetical protein N6G95_10080 [Pediococcus inopinatus]WPC21246.1 hypothetical protein N6G96_08175 [Pediococcus inopinatus]